MMSSRRAIMLVNETAGEREVRHFKYGLFTLAVVTVFCVIFTACGTYAWDDIFDSECGAVIESTGEAEREAVLEPAETVEAAPPIINRVTHIDSKVGAPVLKSFDSVPLDAEFQDFVFQKSEEIGIDPAIVFGMMYHESNFCAGAVGDSGRAIGILQVRIDVHGERMERLGCSNMTDPYECVTVALDYLAECLERYNGDVAKALTAYNRGHYNGTVSRYAHLTMEQSEIIKGE